MVNDKFVYYPPIGSFADIHLSARPCVSARFWRFGAVGCRRRRGCRGGWLAGGGGK